MIKEVLAESESRMKGAVHSLEEDFAGIRTGRASPALVDRLVVEYYGAPTPIQQLANIGVPEPQLITIRPFDPGVISAIEKAIRTSELGLNPSNDGKIIRLALPPLTQERRLELVKVVHRRMEEARIAIRNVRRDEQDTLRDFEKEKEISEDEFFRAKEDLEKLTAKYIALVEQIGERKEHEIKEL